MSLLGDTTFLDQLASSTSLLTDNIAKTDTSQVKGLFGNYSPNKASDYVNGIPQNQFAGNQFQLPYQPGEFTGFGGQFGSGGFNTPYTPGGYTPQSFNQYGNVPVTGNIPSNVTTTTMNDRGGEGDAGGMFGGVQGQNDPSNPRNRQDSYSLNDDGTITQFDASTGLTSTYNTDDEDLTLAQKLFGFATTVPTTASVIEKMLGGFLGGGQPQVDPTDPTTYGYTGPVAKTGLLGFLGNIGKEGLKGKGTAETTKQALESALQTEQEITDATQAATKEFEAKQKAKAKAAANAKIGTLDRNRDGGSGPAGGGQSCFVKGTMLQMADGTEKEISTVELGDNTKGGIVEMTMQGLPQTIYNYKDVLVSGSHWVIEDNEFVAVEDSKHGVLTDKVEPVYTLKTSDHRMWINDIEFGDFETGSDNDWEPHFEMVRQKLNKDLRDGK